MANLGGPGARLLVPRHDAVLAAKIAVFGIADRGHVGQDTAIDLADAIDVVVTVGDGTELSVADDVAQLVVARSRVKPGT